MSEKLIRELSPVEARELLKGILYLMNRYADEQEAM